jgi:NAD(P)-dependent dehydrogenase (short-subunit alcohol dehydrogenase family)
MAIELAKREIRVNCISPGTILTPLMEEFLSTLSDEERNARVDGFPLGLGQPADITSTVIFLLSDASRWITGQNIIVDGGFTAR